MIHNFHQVMVLTHELWKQYIHRQIAKDLIRLFNSTLLLTLRMFRKDGNWEHDARHPIQKSVRCYLILMTIIFSFEYAPRVSGNFETTFPV